MILSGRSFFR
uniref:Uncharacterized protein n=1 Tax=Anguilla anguilla TaxID=7936 RepID=A0A0E9SYW2_ANGAN